MKYANNEITHINFFVSDVSNNIKRHALVSRPNPKQWRMIHIWFYVDNET